MRSSSRAAPEQTSIIRRHVDAPEAAEQGDYLIHPALLRYIKAMIDQGFLTPTEGLRQGA